MKIVPEKSQDLSTEVLELDEVNEVSLCFIVAREVHWKHCYGENLRKH